MKIVLDSTLKSVEIALSGAVVSTQLPVTGSYVDVDQVTFGITAASEIDTATNNTTAVTVVSAPALGKSRQIKLLTVYNVDTAAATVTLSINNNSTLRTILKVTLSVGDNLIITDD